MSRRRGPKVVLVPSQDTVTTLYRFYDADWRLIYVGISGNPPVRFDQHRALKPWWRRVAFIRCQHFDSRNDALIAETMAIRDERPPFNLVGLERFDLDRAMPEPQPSPPTPITEEWRPREPPLPSSNGETRLPENMPEDVVCDLLQRGHDIGQVIRQLTDVRRGDQYQRLHLAIQRWLVRRALKEEVRGNDPQTEEK